MQKKKTVLILGGYGETGKRLAKLLAGWLGIHVRIGGRNEDKAIALAKLINAEHTNEMAQGVFLDAEEHESIRKALQGVDAFIQAGPALPEGIVRSVALAVIQQGVDWMDVQVDPGQARVLREYEKEILDNKLCFCVQAGFHPGLPAAMVRWMATKFDKLEEATTWGFLNDKGGLKYTSGVDEIIEMFRDYTVKEYINGEWLEFKPDMRYKYPRQELGFGTGTSMFSPMDLEEMHALPDLIPTLQRTGFYVGGWDSMTNMAIAPAIMVGQKVLPMISDSRWGKLLSWSTRTFQHPPFGTVLQVNAFGSKDGRKIEKRMTFKMDSGYDLTAIPMAATLRQMITGASRPSGVHYMGHLANPAMLFTDMKKLGVQTEMKSRIWD